MAKSAAARAPARAPARRPAPVPAVRTVAPPPAAAADYAAEASGGFEDADANAFTIPRIYMLQKGSPQVNARDPAHVEGAEPGMLYNTVTQRCFKTLYVVPVKYRQTFDEWYPRDSKAGQGFVASHDVVDPTWSRERGRPYETDRGTIVEDTRNFFVLAAGELDARGLLVDAAPVVLSLRSTQIKRAQNWMTVMSQKLAKRPDGTPFRLPMHASIFAITGEWLKNDKGDWFAWKIVDTGFVPPGSELHEQATGLKFQVESGAAQAARPTDGGAAEADPGAM